MRGKQLKEIANSWSEEELDQTVLLSDSSTESWVEVETVFASQEMFEGNKIYLSDGTVTENYKKKVILIQDAGY